MAPTRLQTTICSVIYWAILTFGGLAVISKVDNQSPEQKLTGVRMLAAFSLVFCAFLSLRSNAVRNATQRGETQQSRRDVILKWGAIKFGVTFFIGFYAALLFADRFFPSLQQKVSDKPWAVKGRGLTSGKRLVTSPEKS